MPAYKRLTQKIGKAVVRTAHREFMDLCEHCGGLIKKGSWYVLLPNRRPLHYACKKLLKQT